MPDPFKGQKPAAVIRSPLLIVSGALLMLVSLYMLAGIFLFGLNAGQARVFICLFLGIPGLLGLVISIFVISTRTEVYEEGFAEFPGIAHFPKKDCVLYADCTGKTPVFARTLGGREYLHHYKVYLNNGHSVDITKWEMKPALLDRLKLSELPTE